MQYDEGPRHVWHLSVPRRVQSGPASNVQGQPGHHCKDRADLPPTKEFATQSRTKEGLPFPEGKLVDQTLDNRMPPVKGQRSIVAANAADVILEPADGAVDGVRTFIYVSKGFAIGVGCGHEKAAGESSVQLGLKGVVIRAGSHELEGNIARQREERPSGISSSSSMCRVQIVDSGQIYAMIADISRFQDKFRGQSVLDGQISISSGTG